MAKINKNDNLFYQTVGSRKLVSLVTNRRVLTKAYSKRIMQGCHHASVLRSTDGKRRLSSSISALESIMDWESYKVIHRFVI